MNNELEHHGILGMKWGVRRYQNEDGSLTAAGKKRYNTMQDASSYARKEGDYWKNSYNNEQQNLKEYEKKYSGKEGLKQYKKDSFEWDMSDDDLDSLMSDKEAESYFKSDMKVMKENAQSMKRMAQEWYDKADAFQNYTVDNIPSKLYNEGKKYAKQWQKGR